MGCKGQKDENNMTDALLQLHRDCSKWWSGKYSSPTFWQRLLDWRVL